MLVAEDAVEDAAVDARVVEGDVQDVHRRVLNVEGFPAAVPLHPILKALVDDVGHLSVITINLSRDTKPSETGKRSRRFPNPHDFKLQNHH